MVEVPEGAVRIELRGCVDDPPVPPDADVFSGGKVELVINLEARVYGYLQTSWTASIYGSGVVGEAWQTQAQFEAWATAESLAQAKDEVVRRLGKEAWAAGPSV